MGRELTEVRDHTAPAVLDEAGRKKQQTDSELNCLGEIIGNYFLSVIELSKGAHVGRHPALGSSGRNAGVDAGLLRARPVSLLLTCVHRCIVCVDVCASRKPRHAVAMSTPGYPPHAGEPSSLEKWLFQDRGTVAQNDPETAFERMQGKDLKRMMGACRRPARTGFY